MKLTPFGVVSALAFVSALPRPTNPTDSGSSTSLSGYLAPGDNSTETIQPHPCDTPQATLAPSLNYFEKRQPANGDGTSCEPNSVSTIAGSCLLIDNGMTVDECKKSCDSAISASQKCNALRTCVCRLLTETLNDDALKCNQCIAMYNSTFSSYSHLKPNFENWRENCGIPTTATSSCAYSTSYGQCTGPDGSTTTIKPTTNYVHSTTRTDEPTAGTFTSTNSDGITQAITVSVMHIAIGKPTTVVVLSNSQGTPTGVHVSEAAVVVVLPSPYAASTAPVTSTVIDDNGSSVLVIETPVSTLSTRSAIPTTMTGNIPGTWTLTGADGNPTSVEISEAEVVLAPPTSSSIEHSKRPSVFPSAQSPATALIMTLVPISDLTANLPTPSSPSSTYPISTEPTEDYGSNLVPTYLSNPTVSSTVALTAVVPTSLSNSTADSLTLVPTDLDPISFIKSTADSSTLISTSLTDSTTAQSSTLITATLTNSPDDSSTQVPTPLRNSTVDSSTLVPTALVTTSFSDSAAGPTTVAQSALVPTSFGYSTVDSSALVPISLTNSTSDSLTQGPKALALDNYTNESSTFVPKGLLSTFNNITVDSSTLGFSSSSNTATLVHTSLNNSTVDGSTQVSTALVPTSFTNSIADSSTLSTPGGGSSTVEKVTETDTVSPPASFTTGYFSSTLTALNSAGSDLVLADDLVPETLAGSIVSTQTFTSPSGTPANVEVNIDEVSAPSDSSTTGPAPAPGTSTVVAGVGSKPVFTDTLIPSTITGTGTTAASLTSSDPISSTGGALVAVVKEADSSSTSDMPGPVPETSTNVDDVFTPTAVETVTPSTAVHGSYSGPTTATDEHDSVQDSTEAPTPITTVDMLLASAYSASTDSEVVVYSPYSASLFVTSAGPASEIPTSSTSLSSSQDSDDADSVFKLGAAGSGPGSNPGSGSDSNSGSSSTATGSTVSGSTATDPPAPESSVSDSSPAADPDSAVSEPSISDSTAVDSTATGSTVSGSIVSDSSPSADSHDANSDSAVSDSTAVDSTATESAVFGSAVSVSTAAESAVSDSPAKGSPAKNSPDSDSTAANPLAADFVVSDSPAKGSPSEGPPPAADSSPAAHSSPAADSSPASSGSRVNKGGSVAVGPADDPKAPSAGSGHLPLQANSAKSLAPHRTLAWGAAIAILAISV